MDLQYRILPCSWRQNQAFFTWWNRENSCTICISLCTPAHVSPWCKHYQQNFMPFVSGNQLHGVTNVLYGNVSLIDFNSHLSFFPSITTFVRVLFPLWGMANMCLVEVISFVLVPKHLLLNSFLNLRRFGKHPSSKETIKERMDGKRNINYIRKQIQ